MATWASGRGAVGDEWTRWLLGYYTKGLFDEILWLELTLGADGKARRAVVGASWEDPHRGDPVPIVRGGMAGVGREISVARSHRRG